MGARSWLSNLAKELSAEMSWRLLSRRIKGHGDSWIFLCNAHIGDTFALCSLLPKFVEQHGSAKVTLVVRAEQEKLVRLFPHISGLVVRRNLPSTRINIKMSALKFQKGSMLPGHIYFAPAAEISDYSYLDVFRLPLRLTRENKPSPLPNFQVKDETHLPTEFSSKKGNTVLLSPYAKSVPLFSTDFWALLVKELQSMGYEVATNVSKDEQPLENTLPLRFDLDQDGLSLAKGLRFFIGIRSGLCDVLHGIACNMVVLYGDEEERRYFSLFHTGYNHDSLIEMVVDSSGKRNYPLVVSKIMDTLNRN